MLLKSLLVAVALLSSTPANVEPMEFDVPPAMNLSAIHLIYCVGYNEDGEKMRYQGTGEVIADGVVTTANHVGSNEDCQDTTAGVPLKMYKQDKRHDFALMTGDVDAPAYIRYSCRRPGVGEIYISYGWSSVGIDADFYHPILRNNAAKATKKIDDNQYDVPGFQNSVGLRFYDWAIAPGMSGGPVADIFGTMIAINNAGNDKETLLYDLADTALCTGKWD